MFFSSLGKIVVRYWPAVLAAWVMALTAAWLKAPAWEQVTRSGEVSFLPAGVPSRQADDLFKSAFELQYSASNIAIVFARTDGELTEADREFIAKDVTAALAKIA